ncbi:MAG TPA: DNA polymerase III subunit delta, partial [Cyclobacteriaceae bacterium]|nr:DNA polymerase III subunit delta [Cyclobacteriaceae bacterium]
MDSKAAEILKSLKAKKFEPVYFLQGEETYYIDIIADYIENNVLAEHEKGFNQVIMYGNDVSMVQVLNSARRYPMMADRQVVIVKEAQDIQDINKEQGAKLLLDYLKSPVPSTVLVFCHKHKSLDKRRELGKSIEKLCLSTSFKKLYDNQVPQFIAGYLKEKGYKMEEPAIQVLAEYVGTDLHRISNEIEKLFINREASVPVSAAEIMQEVGISKEYNVFELQKAIISKNSYQAQRIVKYFASNTKKNPLIPVVAFLYAFFHKLLLVSSARVSSDKEIAQVLKISPYIARDYTTALRFYPLPKIIENISLLKQADLKLKGVNSTDN